jgi:hypothetical protein
LGFLRIIEKIHKKKFKQSNKRREKRRDIMNAKNLPKNLIPVAMLVLFASLGCSITGSGTSVGELRTESESVFLDDADFVSVEINMDAGQLDVRGGAIDLLTADFVYDVDELKPEVAYDASMLTILTPTIDFGIIDVGIDSLWGLDDFRYEWDLRLNDDVPMEMSVYLGAGGAYLELGSLSLTNLIVETGVGEVAVDLSDSASLIRLDVELGAGDVSVDLTGNWQNDLIADINAGVGELTLHLPDGVCVRVDVETGAGDVNIHGLSLDSGKYINDACGQPGATLQINLTAGVGSINLEVRL